MNEGKALNLIGRSKELFEEDINKHEIELKEIISSSSFLVIGGAGSIGQAVVKEIFSRNPKKLHVVDINENNLTELVRDIRSSFGYIDGEFRTFTLDIGSLEYDAFIKSDGKYDYQYFYPSNSGNDLVFSSETENDPSLNYEKDLVFSLDTIGDRTNLAWASYTDYAGNFKMQNHSFEIIKMSSENLTANYKSYFSP